MLSLGVGGEEERKMHRVRKWEGGVRKRGDKFLNPEKCER